MQICLCNLFPHLMLIESDALSEPLPLYVEQKRYCAVRRLIEMVMRLARIFFKLMSE